MNTIGRRSTDIGIGNVASNGIPDLGVQRIQQKRSSQRNKTPFLERVRKLPGETSSKRVEFVSQRTARGAVLFLCFEQHLKQILFW